MNESAGYIDTRPNGATFDDDRLHRYSLWRRFEPEAHIEKMCAFICLNPSTADETKNDPTVTRCIGYSRDWGFHGFVMLNAFSYRATDPSVMKARQAEAIGDPENLRAILAIASRAGRVVCGWGNHGTHLGRSDFLLAKLREAGVEPLALKITNAGEPWHPLYLSSKLIPFPIN